MDSKKIYYNAAQQNIIAMAPNKTILIAGRGFGKSEGVDAFYTARNAMEMKRSSGGIVSPSYRKLLLNTLPPVILGWERMGFKRNKHFIVGRRGDESLGFKLPYICPEKDAWHFTIHWMNGSIHRMISLERQLSANSMSLDYAAVFEARYINKKRFEEEVIPAIRGNRNKFKNCPWHEGLHISSDQPLTKEGTWLWDFEKQNDADLNELILDEYRLFYSAIKDKRWRSAVEHRRNLRIFRKQCTYYVEYDSLENVDILGFDYIKNLENVLSPSVFLASVMGKKIMKFDVNMFYTSYETAIHSYMSENLDYIKGLDFNQHIGDSCRFDGDMNWNRPLIISCDYNTDINSLVVGQEDGGNAKTIKSMFVKKPRKLQELIQAFCNYYSPRIDRNVIYYYDNTAIVTNAITDETFRDMVVKVLKSNGYRVRDVYVGQLPWHRVRHQQIDNAFKGDPSYLFPMFNKLNCENLITAFERTAYIVGKKGIEKDKRIEKQPDSPEYPAEHRPHITEAWDCLFHGMNFYKSVGRGQTSPSRHS